MLLKIFKNILIVFFTIMRFLIKAIIMILESYVIFFKYLYRDGFRHLMIVLKFLFKVLVWLSFLLLAFTVRRLITLRLFLKDCYEVLPFLFFKRSKKFMYYNMLLTFDQIKKQRRRQTIFYTLLCCFFVTSFLLIYDMADDESFLFLYDFYKWW